MDTHWRVILVVLLQMLALWSASLAYRQLDCSKYIFAPGCRGISAKRASIDSFSEDRPSYPIEREPKARFEPHELRRMMEAMANARVPTPLMAKLNAVRSVTRGNGRTKSSDLNLARMQLRDIGIIDSLPEVLSEVDEREA